MAPQPSPRQLRRDREQASRRSDVVAAASVVFAEKGFHDTQIAEIARVSELSLASIYSLFSGKDEIYDEVIASAAGSVREAVEREVESVSDPAERLLRVIDSLFTCWQDNHHFIHIYARGTQGLPWATRQVMGEGALWIFRSFRDWVISLARAAARSGHLRGVDPEAFAIAMIGAMTRTAVHWIEEYPDRPLSQAAPLVRAIFSRLVENGA